jgi:hypothetical protein
MPLADTLLRLAAEPHLYQPKWSDQIMAEVSRTLEEKFGLLARRPCIAKVKFGGISRKRWLTAMNI